MGSKAGEEVLAAFFHTEIDKGTKESVVFHIN